MCAKCGGSMKKMKAGGQSNMTKTMPGYNATTQPMTMKKGGTTSLYNRSVQTSCKNGLVRDANGKCVMQRKMKNGGSTAFKKLAPPYDKATYADKIA